LTISVSRSAKALVEQGVYRPLGCPIAARLDSSVATAWGTYGAVAPNQCLTGDMYFEGPTGVDWSSLNFAYTSADFSTQQVYVWNS
jgi:hypothetical protein